MPKGDMGPFDLRETSVTERADFRTCRRRWFLNTVHRLAPHGGETYFWYGNLGHYTLEHYYLALLEGDTVANAEAWAKDAFEHYLEESLREVKVELGFLWESAEQEYLDMAEMGRVSIDGYFRMERETGGFGRVVAVEERYHVPILMASGRKAYQRGLDYEFFNPQLSGRFDLVIERKDGSLWVIDHKFLGSKHNSAYLDIDDQLTGYAYVWWRATGVFPRGQVYNVLLKKAPHPPKRLKDAKDGTAVLSKDKGQATTYSLYLEEVRRLGLDRREYDDILAFLKDRGWQDYYVQEGVFRNKQQLREFEINLWWEWRDMREVATHPEKAYPSPSSINCPGCPVRVICATMQDRGDVQAIVEQQFTVLPDRR